MSSLDVCTNEDDHFVIPMKERATGLIHNVECVVDMDLFYTGYAPEYRIFFKDQWEIVRHQPEPQNKVLAAIAMIGGTFVLALIIGCIAHVLTS